MTDDISQFSDGNFDDAVADYLANNQELLHEAVQAAVSAITSEVWANLKATGLGEDAFSSLRAGPLRSLSPIIEEEIRKALTEPAEKIAREIADAAILSRNLRGMGRYQSEMDPMLKDAVREALEEPAKKIAEDIAKSGSMHRSLMGAGRYGFEMDPMLKDAVREALAEPAKKIAEDIAKSGMAYRSLMGFGRYGYDMDPMLASAVRAALAEPAKKIAEEVVNSGSPIRWFEEYAKNPIEPAVLLAEYSPSNVEEPDSFSPIQADGVTSKSFEHCGSVFDGYEIEIKSFQGLTQAFDRISRKFEGLSVSWRGQAEHTWSLSSSLYRKFASSNGEGVSRHQVLPSEADLVNAEKKVLLETSQSWRMGNLSAVELLVRMQHRGIPTRLLDVTRNPLLALWFAVTERHEKDARIFAIGSQRTPGSNASPVFKEPLWNAETPFWFDAPYQTRSTATMWGTGTRIREIYPPDYDQRIPAQNALFLLDGAPSITEEVLGQFNKVTNGSWNVSDIAASMSIVLFPVELKRRSFKDLGSFSPVIVIRIPAGLKEEIGDILSRTYGYSWANIYPDIEGVKTYLDKNPEFYR